MLYELNILSYTHHMHNNTDKTVKHTVLDAIKAGQVHMKPRWHFVLRGILLVLESILLALSLRYLASFIMFIVYRSGVWFTPGFGFRGLRVFLLSIPWLLILVSVAFLVLLELLVKRYAFAYKKPLAYSVV